MPSYGGNAFINFRWVNTYIIAFIFSRRTQRPYGPKINIDEITQSAHTSLVIAIRMVTYERSKVCLCGILH